MKLIIKLSFLLITLLSATALWGQITLTSQAEVDAWDQSITVLEDTLIITGSDISNIEALSNLTDIAAVLEIENNQQLTNIDGLRGLRNVTGLINVQNNQALTSIDGFLGLNDFDGRITLQSNDGLENIDGFRNLLDVSGRITLWNNDGLTDIDGFINLRFLSGTISITNSDLLTTIDPLQYIGPYTGTLELSGNDGLTNLDFLSGSKDIPGSLILNGTGSTIDISALSDLENVTGNVSLSRISSLVDVDIFSNLKDVIGSISILNNPNLVNINGFSDLTALTGEIHLRNNHSLTNIDGFSNLSNIAGSLEIAANENLTNINGLAGLITIEGELVIHDNDLLQNLDALAGFSDISGKLTISDNDSLLELDELSSLSELTGSITLIRNHSVTNLDALINLTDIAGGLSIIENNSLAEIDGLSNLSNVSGSLNVSSNPSLTGIDGLAGLTQLTGRVDISGNDNLVNVEGLSNLSTIEGTLGISSNNALTNINGLQNLTRIIGRLYINRNSSLVNIEGLLGLTDIEGGARLGIEANSSLSNLDGLAGLVNADGNLFIIDNDALTNTDGFLVLTEISTTADIRLIGNDALTNIDGFSNVKHVRRHLRISNNSNLISIDGFSGIEEVTNTGHVEIDRNSSLTNIDGLSQLKKVLNSGRVTIQNNDALENIDGFYNLDEVRGRIFVKDNDLLSLCCGLSDAIEDGDKNRFDIENNNSGCDSIPDILDACSLEMFFDISRPCEGIDNGSITFFARDYDATPFNLEWEETTVGTSGNIISTSDVFSLDNLAPGIYNVSITLPNGARESAENIVLDPIIGSVFEITKLTSTNSTNGTASGNLYIEYSGGRAPYALAWTGPNSDSRSGITSTSYTMFGLGPGEYSIQLTDAEGQSKLVDITLLDETAPVFPCTDPLDIVILNDVSGSVDPIEYEESKAFFTDFLQVANIGMSPMQSQAAIIEWSSSDQQSLIVPLTGDLGELENYSNASRAFSESTALHPALTYGYEYLDANGREEVEKVLILSTDGYPTESLIALADEFKAEGYHIITIAFDHAYERGNLRDILTLTASVPLLASGAPSYSELNEDLAENIVTRYLCPLAPGESSSVYFHRDGAIAIDSIVGACPITDLAEITFTVTAQRELSIPAGTSVMFYHNDPLLFGATPILEYKLPCAIPVGTTDSHTVNLPIANATKLYALLNDDGSQRPPLTYPITDLKEIAYSNNIDTISICTGSEATLQALKYTSTSIPVCDSILTYTIDVCNIGGSPATDVVVTDLPPPGALLMSASVNDNGCSQVNGSTYDIPVACCVSISLTYNSTEVADGYYGNQNVILSGPDNQSYIDYDGNQSSAEDVTIGGADENCPSSEIWITKAVSDEQICDDGFLVYTYTIHNETNSVIQGAKFTDFLDEPMEWVYKPYAMEGLSIMAPALSGTVAEFIIDEIPADTIATFQIDAYTSDWEMDGTVTSAATLENVIDLEHGGLQTLESNATTTTVYDSDNFSCDSLWTFTLEVAPQKEIIVFPNPTTGMIKFQNLENNTKYRLLDYSGVSYEEGIYRGQDLELKHYGVNLIQLIFEDRMIVVKGLKI